MNSIYLDYAATTPLDPAVLQKMQTSLQSGGVFGNSASSHAYGKAAAAAIEEARAQIAQLIHAHPSEVIFTSGATESNNLAIKGAARLYQGRGKHIITMKTEHKSVLDPCQHLEKEGYRLTYLSPLANGRLDLEALAAALTNETMLVSIMQINNETGVFQDLAAISAFTNERGILLHVDAAQGIGKLPLNLEKIPIDLVSLSAHKVYGPKGIGALYLRKKPRVRVEPLIHGGGHEQGMRSGTLATHQIAGMGEAFYLVSQYFQDEYKRIKMLRDQFWQGLNAIPHLHLNSDPLFSVPHILNFRFEGMQAQAILDQLPNLAASTASACQGRGTEGSYVLRAMGLNDAQIKSSVRFSFGRMTSTEEIEEAIALLQTLFCGGKIATPILTGSK